MGPNVIHPAALVDDSVSMGSGNVIGPGAVLTGGVVIGDDNWIGPYVCIGISGDIAGSPKASAGAWWTGQSSQSRFGVRLGSGNVVKEGVTVHAGSHRHTTIGNSCYLMPRSHLGHDCWTGDAVWMSPTAQVAGHVAIGDRAILGMGALIHQFSSVGPVAMIGMGAVVRGTVEPARTVVGNPHRVSGINRVGLERMLDDESISRELLTNLRQRDSYSRLPLPLRDSIRRWQAIASVGD